MNRRDAIKSALAAAGLTAPVEVRSVPPADGPPALAVIEYSGFLSARQRQGLYLSWQRAMTGTPFEGVKVVVLERGLRLRFFDAAGNERSFTVEHDKQAAGS